MKKLPIQWQLKSHWSLVRDNPVKPVPSSEECPLCIRWWLQKWAPAVSLFVYYCICSFAHWASRTGLGVHLQDLTAEWTWMEEEQSLRVSVTEMKAVQLALNAFHHWIMKESIALMSNSATWQRLFTAGQSYSQSFSLQGTSRGGTS